MDPNKERPPVKIELIKPCWIGGKPYPAGTVLTVREGTARDVVGMGKAKYFVAAAPPAADAAAEDKGKGGAKK